MRTSFGDLNPELIDSFFNQPCIQLADVTGENRLDLQAIPKVEVPRLTITVQDESYLEKKAGA